MAGRYGLMTILFTGVAALAAPASAQPIGTFSWQLAPYCNVVTLNVTQNGAVYTLDGYDTQCGGSARGSATGTAFVNPSGAIGIGLTIVHTPGGVPVHVEASIDLATLGGAWKDSHGNSGAFVFTPGGAASGSPRPLSSGAIPDGAVTEAKLADGAVTGAKIADGTIGAQDIDPGQVQRRIQSACPAGQLMTGVNQNGTVVCEAVSSGSGGDITEVIAGTGLAGGGTTGAVTVRALFAGTGTANTVARTDHTHGVGGVTGANTVVGEMALDEPAVGSSHTTGIGFRAAYAGGTRNTAIGSLALGVDALTQDNTALGSEALAVVATGSSFNTAAGSRALSALTTGQGNVAVGERALQSIAAGTGNIAIGRAAGVNLTSGGNNIYLGSLGNTTEDNTIRIGGGAHARAYITGVRGVTTGVNNAVAVMIDGTGQLGTVSSSRRTKFDIADLDAAAAAAIQRLRPVQFRYRDAFADGSTPIQYGLIAEEVQDVLPDLVAVDADGQPSTVKYHVLPSLLLAEVQRLERERRRLEVELTQDASRIADLERRLDTQAQRLDELAAGRDRAARR